MFVSGIAGLAEFLWHLVHINKFVKSFLHLHCGELFPIIGFSIQGIFHYIYHALWSNQATPVVILF